ncbi:MAG TPA: phosphatase [Thermoanaerobaculia bacterium]|nr:phosphatase [Thermoanaerobaculia bacterium]
MSYRHQILLLGLALIALSALKGGWLLLLAWLGANFLVLGIAHARGGHRVFGKRPDGTLPLWSWGLFFPLLAYTAGVWHLLRLLTREPACQGITEQLVVGRRLLPSEVEGEFDNYIDLTAELAEPAAIRRCSSYRCVPILDGAAPSPEVLREAVRSLRPGRTFIHCAQGHGRTGLFALAVLLESGGARNIEEGLQKLTAVRPGIRLSEQQIQCARRYAETRTPLL